jgi:hypothetical protein
MNADWLTLERARAWLRILALGLALALLHGWATILLSHQIALIPRALDPAGKPAATDFLGFWSAGTLALQGHADRAYQPEAMIPIQTEAAWLAPGAYLGFFYPPVFLLACVPFALLPYPAAVIAFVAAPLAPLLVCLRRLFPTIGLLPALAFPAMMLNAATGQTGFLTAACFAGAALWLETNPVAAGACLGLLACKPHLALGVPVALVAARRWRAAVAAAGTAIGLAALSWAVFGAAAWHGFLNAAPLARDALENDRNDWGKSFSPFAAARLLHAGLTTAYAVQAIAALIALGMVIAMCRRRPGALPEMAILAAAAMVCTPHVMDYDLVCLLIPAGWLAASAAATVWLPWEKLALALLFAAALLGRVVALGAGVPLGPLAVIAFLAVVWRRA